MSWLDRFNALESADAEAELLACCDSRSWARAVAARRPYVSTDALLDAASEEWWRLPHGEWLHAFAAHPRIGESAAAKPQHGAGDSWSVSEQQGATASADDTKSALVDVNRAYEERFGYTYIVCATGKSGEEMLQIARERLRNEDYAELLVAAGEQVKITKLRLLRLIAS